MYVKSESGRGPVWLRELRILCKLCKLWTERRSSRSSRVDLNALITRSCKNREGRSIRKRGGKPATHKHAIFPSRFFSFAQKKCTSYSCVCVPLLAIVSPYILSGFVSTFVCSLYICISVHWSCRCSRGCCRVSCLQTRFSFLFFFFTCIYSTVSFTFLSFVPVSRVFSSYIPP